MSRRFWQTVMAVAALVLSARCVQAQTTIQYYHADAIGSVRLITDQAGAVVAYHDYVPFGAESPLAAVSDPRLFAGQERDVETGFDYFGARYFSAAIGRFTRPDDAVFSDPADPQSWNQYTYALNNPLRYVDPSGHAPEDCPPGTAEGVFCTSVTATPLLDAWALSQSFFAESFARFNAQLTAAAQQGRERLNPVTSVFGYDRNNPLPSCFGTAMKSTLDHLNPLSPDVSAVGDAAGGIYAISKYNQALQYARSTASRTFRTPFLLFPNKSTVFNGLLKQSGKGGLAGFLFGANIALFEGLNDEFQMARRGLCQ